MFYKIENIYDECQNYLNEDIEEGLVDPFTITMDDVRKADVIISSYLKEEDKMDFLIDREYIDMIYEYIRDNH